MIFDVLENAQRYFSLNKGFEKAFAFLKQTDLQKLSVGKYEIDENRVFAIVAKENGRKKEHAQLETHNKYIDIQFVLSGTDNMGWKSKSSCQQVFREYDPKTDLQFFADDPDVWLSTNPGMYAIFFPEDAHMPLISSENIHKIIIKIAIEQ
jgi:biofilm protein TabA